VLGISALTAFLNILGGGINSTTVALTMVLVVLFVAATWGSGPAIAAAVLGVLSFNFFFLPPAGTLAIADPENWIAFVVFLITAITAGQLSARVNRRAEEAEAGRREIKRLYDELRSAFERASHAEALRQSERLKSALLDAVTHDLRTPLTSIKASATALLDELNTQTSTSSLSSLDEEGRREMLEVINEESDRLNRLIEGLVEMARIEAGEFRLRRRWGTIEEMVETALARSKNLLSQQRVRIEIEKDLPVILVDAGAISEVFYTLIENAAKYSPAGTLIRISASRGENDIIAAAVEDRGPGIPPELRERVFDKFFRITASNNPRSQPSGTGMGLAIARGIVEVHDGRIWIESGEGGSGTKVIFTLPIGDQYDGVEMDAESVEQNSVQ